MRKVFIDGGANNGQSTKAFLKEWPDSNEFEIFMFEPNSKPPLLKGKKTKLIRKAIWIYDGEITFFEKHPNSQGNTLLKEKVEKDKRTYKEKSVECVSLSNWIKQNFNKKDTIILKLDIEGAEYEVIKDLYKNEIFKFIDVFFCEIHGLKCGKGIDETKDLLKLLENANIKPYVWDSEIFKYAEFKNNYYTNELIEKEYKKWKKRTK